MHRFNVADPEFSHDADDPEGYKAGLFRPGPGDRGDQDTGTSVYDLPPGQSICPYHYELGEEEWLLVPLRAPVAAHAGRHDATLEPHDLVFFPIGRERRAQGHERHGRARPRAHVLRTSGPPTGTVYPDSDKSASVGARRRRGRARAPLAATSTTTTARAVTRLARSAGR